MISHVAPISTSLPIHFCISDAPTTPNALSTFINELETIHCQIVLCISSSEKHPITLPDSIQVLDFYFPDGSVPDLELVKRYFDFLESLISDSTSPISIAIHCVSGLGRSPLMVAMALIARGGIDAPDAIEIVRKVRRGAMNRKQIAWLMDRNGFPLIIKQLKLGGARRNSTLASMTTNWWQKLF